MGDYIPIICECVLIVPVYKHVHVCASWIPFSLLSVLHSTLFLGSGNHSDSLTTAVTPPFPANTIHTERGQSRLQQFS